MTASPPEETLAERDRDRAFTLDVLRAIDPRRVEASLAELRHRISDERRRDLVYRAFHSSHKMYHAATLAEVAVEATLAPLGYEPPARGEDEGTHLTTAMECWRLDHRFVRLVHDLRSCQWSQERNGDDAWAADARLLLGGLFTVHEAALATLEAMSRMCSGKGFLWEDGAYDATDALFLEVWLPVGLALRYWHDDSLREDCRALLAAKVASVSEQA